MANCPKCGKKLHLYNWKQNCPHCGVNLVYYNSNERLLKESEETEIAHAHFQPGVDRAKASTIGSNPARFRIVLTVLPLAASMLPLASLEGAEGTKSINALGIYNYINNVGFGNVFGNIAKGNTLSIAAVAVFISAILVLVGGLFLMKSLGKSGRKINFTFDFIKFALSVTSIICFAISDIPQCYPESGYTSGKLGFGIFIFAGLYLAELIYSQILAVKGLPIKHTQCLIGGIPSDEYFKMVEDGVSDLEIRKIMVERLTVMQEEFKKKDEEARAQAEAERQAWK